MIGFGVVVALGVVSVASGVVSFLAWQGIQGVPIH
jgi:hypothetical protein